MKSIIAYVVAAAIAGGAGVVHGQQVLARASLKSSPAGEEKKTEHAAPAAKNDHGGGHGAKGGGHGAKEPETPTNLRELKPIVTNLAEPPNAWARLEVAIVMNQPLKPEDEPLVAEISNDIITYLRTISASYIEGTRGLQRLREDLKERAIIRTDGKVRDILLETLVVQ